MTSIGAAWDRTTEVLRGRWRMLAGIAALTFVLPGVIRAALPLFVAPGAAGPARALVAIVALLAAVATIYGQLVLVAAVSDPATLQRDAYRIARRRFWPAIGLVALLGIAFAAALIPIGIALGTSGVDFQTMDANAALAALSSGTIAFVMVYVLLYVLVGIYVSTRLFVLNPVIVNERLGVGSFARSFALTRGSFWRILGTVVLLVVVLFVAGAAVRAVVGILAILILGTDHASLAAFLAAVAVSVVTAIYSVVMITLATQFYLLARERRDVGSDRPAA